MRFVVLILAGAYILLGLTCSTQGRGIGRREYANKRKQKERNANLIPIFRSIREFTDAQNQQLLSQMQIKQQLRPIQELRAMEEIPVTEHFGQPQEELTKLVLLKPNTEQANNAITTSDDYNEKGNNHVAAGDADDNVDFEDIQEKDPRNAAKVPKLMLLKPGVLDATETANDGRTLKHLFMLNGLSGGSGGYNQPGYGAGNSRPSIFLYNPTNVTNVNNNTAVNNVVTTPAPAAGGGGRINFIGMRMPTEYYQKRKIPNMDAAMTENNVAMQHLNIPPELMGINLNNARVIPLDMPNNYQKGNNIHWRRPNNGNYFNYRRNPFVTFANNLRRVQFI